MAPCCPFTLVTLHVQASGDPQFEVSFAFPEKWYSKCQQFPGLSQAHVTADSALDQVHNGSYKLTRFCSQRGRVHWRQDLDKARTSPEGLCHASV